MNMEDRWKGEAKTILYGACVFNLWPWLKICGFQFAQQSTISMAQTQTTGQLTRMTIFLLETKVVSALPHISGYIFMGKQF